MSNGRRKLARLSLAGMLALALLALVSATETGSSEAQQGAMHNCPLEGKWAIAVWDGDDGTDATQALGTCGEGAVAVAYSIDPEMQVWSRWFAGRPEITTLGALNNMQGVMALGGTAASAPAPSSSSAQQGAMHDCPLQGKWAIAVWDGDDGTDAEQALATCGEGAVAVAYSIDPEMQVWSRWFAGRPEITTLGAVNNRQGVMVLGGAQAPTTATPSPTPTLTPTPTPTPTPTGAGAGGPPTDYLDTFHAVLEMSMELDLFGMDFAAEGDFEGPDSCSCDISASMVGIPLIEERVVVIGNKAWIDMGDGWRETTPSDPEVAEALGMCPACPSFWEDFAFEAPPLPGEQETKNGVAAIHYTLAELYEAFAGIGLIPEEMEGISVDALDVWVAEDGGWLVCLDMEICVEAEAMEEFTGPLEGVDSVCMAMSIDITDANDPSIQVNAP
jgi:hypothetical protein